MHHLCNSISRTTERIIICDRFPPLPPPSYLHQRADCTWHYRLHVQGTVRTAHRARVAVGTEQGGGRGRRCARFPLVVGERSATRRGGVATLQRVSACVRGLSVFVRERKEHPKSQKINEINYTALRIGYTVPVEENGRMKPFKLSVA